MELISYAMDFVSFFMQNSKNLDRINTIILFGSVARGEANKKSDIDLLVDTAPGGSLLDRVAFMQDLQDLLDRKVDVVTARSLHWYIRDKVLSEAVPL